MSKPLKVLLVEDSALDADLIVQELRQAGFSPDWSRVDTESDYLAQLSPEVEIVLSDYTMPKFDGFKALRLLKERALEIPFIIVSGTIGEDTAVEAMKLGATDYLLKDRLTRLGPAVFHALRQNAISRERKLAQETLQLREQALGEVSQGVLICDENRLIIYANRSFATITGYAEAEVLGRSCAILQGPLSDPGTIGRMRAALAADEPFEGEILNYRKDGSVFWNELSLAPIRGLEGAPVRYLGIQRDITVNKLSREALQKSETEVRHERALLRALIDSIPDLIFLKDKNSAFLSCNKAFERHVGVRESELVGQTDLDIMPRDAAEAFRQLDEELLASGRVQRKEEWIPDGHGGGAEFETVKTPYYSSEGETLGLIAVSRDITERVRAETERRILAERLRLATKAGEIGIWEMNVLTGTMEWDAQMRVLFGLPLDGGVNVVDEIYRTMHADDLERVTAEFAEALRPEGRPLNTEYRIHRLDDGGLRHIRSMATVIRDDAGEALRIVGTNWDVTDERVRERHLAEALALEKQLVSAARAGDRAKSEFLAVMSHEVRTPMNGVLGFAELIANAPGLPPECLEYTRVMTASGEALLRILDDILVFSRLEAGALEIENSLLAPREVLEDIRSLFTPIAQEKDLSLEVTVGEEVPELIWNDAGRLRQVLLNLVGNALKFTTSGLVALGARASTRPLNGGEPAIDLYVRDTGPGISDEDRGRIFETFVQVDSSISRRYGGTGLGLSISQRLIELMGGELAVTSRLGRGSEFYVTLPVKVPADARRVSVRGVTKIFGVEFAAHHPLRILLVEDDRVNRRLMTLVLQQLGYEPSIARDGVEAIEMYRQERPDCILMDLQMPQKDGLQATLEIRALEKAVGAGRRVFIAALTANIVAEDRTKCFAAGMDEYMNKPIKPRALAGFLEHASMRLPVG